MVLKLFWNVSLFKTVGNVCFYGENIIFIEFILWNINKYLISNSAELMNWFFSSLLSVEVKKKVNWESISVYIIKV